MKRRQRPEQQIQRAVFAHLRARGAPGIFAFHPANGGYRTPREAAIFKGLGVVPGTPDIIIIKQGYAFALELKADGGKLSDTQRSTIDALRTAGAVAEVAIGLDAALAWLEGHHLLRGEVTA